MTTRIFRHSRFILLLALYLWVQCIVAQEVGTRLNPSSLDSMQYLSEIIITSKQPFRTTATSQTLQGSELQALSTTSVADALKYFAGVQIKDYGGLGGLKTINVRSLGAQHVGIYLDGIRITNAQNGTVDLGKFSL